MSGDGTKTDISPSEFTRAGETVATALEGAAKPGKPPLAVPGTSPADAAAVTLATAMGTRITAASTEMAPRGPAMRTASAAAAQEITAQDIANSQQIKRVSQSQSAIEQLLQGLASGPEPGPPTPTSCAD